MAQFPPHTHTKKQSTHFFFTSRVCKTSSRVGRSTSAYGPVMCNGKRKSYSFRFDNLMLYGLTVTPFYSRRQFSQIINHRNGIGKGFASAGRRIHQYYQKYLINKRTFYLHTYICAITNHPAFSSNLEWFAFELLSILLFIANQIKSRKSSTCYVWGSYLFPFSP